MKIKKSQGPFMVLLAIIKPDGCHRVFIVSHCINADEC